MSSSRREAASKSGGGGGAAAAASAKRVAAQAHTAQAVAARMGGEEGGGRLRGLHGSGVKVRILVSLVQVLGQLSVVYNIPFPGVYSYLTSLLSVVGAVCATPLMTVFPPLMLLLCTGAESEPYRHVHAIMCGLGVLATLAGTVVSLLDYGAT